MIILQYLLVALENYAKRRRRENSILWEIKEDNRPAGIAPAGALPRRVWLQRKEMRGVYSRQHHDAARNRGNTRRGGQRFLRGQAQHIQELMSGLPKVPA